MLTFPYQYKEIDFGRIFNPLILLPVKASWGWQDLWFLVDSGADTVMLPIDLAKKLGFSYDALIKTKLYGIGKQAVYASLLLLGRLDIFEKFSLTFDRKKQAVIFR